ncbi:MAG: amylo-alpha-1,6-glucosidase [Vicinamibacteria bacterium]
MIERRHDDLVRIRPRNDLLYVSQGRTVLATDRDGFFDGGPDRGLFVHQTRLLSRYRYSVNGRAWKPVAISNVSQHSWMGYYVSLPPGVSPGVPDHGSGHVEEASEQTLELRLSRYVGGGMHEDLDLANFTLHPISFRLELELEADFADLEETRGERKQQGSLEYDWKEEGGGAELAFHYHAEHRNENEGNEGVSQIDRGLRVRIHHASSKPSRLGSGVGFAVELPPQGRWHACLDFIAEIEDTSFAPTYSCRSFQSTDSVYDRLRDLFLDESTQAGTPESGTLAPVVFTAMEQAKRDLASLRLHDLDSGARAWTMAAGLPVYVALFGRDTLTTALQSALLGPEMMDGTLQTMARFQGRETNDWRDEEPGRMLHEAHTGPLAHLGFHPRRRYYGSITTSGFYPVVLAELWHWTGDKERVTPFIEPALSALRWLDERSDHNDDGFYDYWTRSSQGVVHQAWKDSRDAIVYEDGSMVKPPIATCEEQAFVYVAKLHLSEVLWWLDRKEEAKRLFHEAAELKKRFNETFWMEEEGFFALGLDANGRPIRSITSNPGHCLAAGIVDKRLAARTAERLMEDDLFTGWGVRTLSSRHPAYNPYSYHRGSVWPVEQGSFAFGFARYGLHDEVERICRAQFEAARLFEFCRLPEVMSGHGRDRDHPFPALYPQTNSPQAWSASTVFYFVQALLGLYPYAPLDLLLVDPHLPPWLPEISLRNLRLGESRVSLRFFRRGDKSDYEVVDARGSIHVVRQPSPWSLTAGFGERLKDALTSLLPGK